ncbi:BnaC09g18230D [Brassica napus]|uniref:BnaC09g18230D protein n=2 Tax=Brassica TaxID=3705 RepID=A0A078GVF5_BRANA|nr:BnaC09g18230D [Brassica napus]
MLNLHNEWNHILHKQGLECFLCFVLDLFHKSNHLKLHSHVTLNLHIVRNQILQKQGLECFLCLVQKLCHLN